MRLGQFARKYNIRVQDLISYLENDAKEEIHSNTKLSDKVESDILDFFGIEAEVIQKELPVIEEEPEIASESKKKESQESEAMPEPVAEEVSEWDAEDSEYVVKIDKATTLPETPMDDIASVEGEIAEATEHTPKEEPEVANDKEVKQEKEAIKEDEVIQTDKLLEMLESEDTPANLDKIKLIKASKKELSGLKVLGKVDLPEPKKKPQPDEQQEKEQRNNGNGRSKRPTLSDEEREKRRLKAKRKKEEFEARQEKRRKEQAEKERKRRKEAHYKRKIEQAKTETIKPKVQQQPEPAASPVASEAPQKRTKDKPQPKTLLGKWWRWMNT
jgi:hypothetical protein